MNLNIMLYGGRGASSGISNKGKKYGTEYTTLYQHQNIKFVKYNNGNATAPMETMTKNRIYVTINNQDKIKFISFYDKNNKRYKQIDLDQSHKDIKGTHKHLGYEHDEKGTYSLNDSEKQIVDKIKNVWYNNYKKL